MDYQNDSDLAARVLSKTYENLQSLPDREEQFCDRAIAT